MPHVYLYLKKKPNIFYSLIYLFIHTQLHYIMFACSEKKKKNLNHDANVTNHSVNALENGSAFCKEVIQEMKCLHK